MAHVSHTSGPEKGKDRSKFRFLDILKIFYCHEIRLREYQFCWIHI